MHNAMLFLLFSALVSDVLVSVSVVAFLALSIFYSILDKRLG